MPEGWSREPRALKPRILFFDEPTSALDPELTGEVLKVIRSLADLHIAMVIVTHEMAFARDISHRVVFMAGGGDRGRGNTRGGISSQIMKGRRAFWGDMERFDRENKMAGSA